MAASTYGIDGFAVEQASTQPLGVIDLIILCGSIAITVYIIIMNLYVMISILRDPKIRQLFFFRHILFIAVAQFLQGTLIIPLHIESFIKDTESWTTNVRICLVWYLTDLVLVVVITYLFLMLMFERFFSLTYPQIITNSCLGWMMIISPWILSIGLVLFLYYTIPLSLANIFTNSFDNTCLLPDIVINIYTCVGFLLPAGFVFGFCWANCLIRCLLRRQYVQNLGGDDPRVYTTASSVVALCFVFMYLPANSKLFLPTELQSKSWINIALYISFVNAALTPTLWLMIPSLRNNCCLCCKPTRRTRRRNNTRSVNADEIYARMLEPEATQPSTTTKL